MCFVEMMIFMPDDTFCDEEASYSNILKPVH